ncbi:MAG: S8 family serine peptidase, partial [Saprospiraceae bacterium]|nr:S8 family serine peptidase [Saprospiraceae bacterium]
MTSNYLHTSVVTVLLLLTGTWLNKEAITNKITPELREILQSAPDEVHTVFVLLKDQIEVELMFAEMKKANLPVEARAKQLIQALQKKAALTQGTVKNKLTQLKGVQRFHAYWITNVFEVTADAAAIEAINQWQEVDLIEPVVAPTLFHSEVEAAPNLPTPNGTELGLRAINAPRMWRLGYTGYGRKVLLIDSGQNVAHPALKANFWGHNTGRANAWTGTATPDDCGDHHGTHVTGIAVGLDRTTNDTIGVAFNARWMGSPI